MRFAISIVATLIILGLAAFGDPISDISGPRFLPRNEC